MDATAFVATNCLCRLDIPYGAIPLPLALWPLRDGGHAAVAFLWRDVLASQSCGGWDRGDAAAFACANQETGGSKGHSTVEPPRPLIQ
jgi:hypothetical protein